jgi:addiction module RelE/StbE family toxin
MGDFVFDFSEEFIKSMKKLKKKDKTMFLRIRKKLEELIKKPEEYKPLRNVLAGYWRIQFGSFVLIYKIEGTVIKIISLDHHDKSY